MHKTFLSLIVLLLLSLQPANATSDAGENAELLGIMGKDKQWALVFFSNVQAEYVGSFHAIPIKKGNTQIETTVSIDFERDEEKVSKSERKTRQKIMKLKTPSTERNLALYNYFLSQLPPKTKVKYKGFTPASKLKVILEKNATTDFQKRVKRPNDYQATYQLPSGEKLYLKRKILKSFDSMLFWNEEGQYSCIQNNRPICSNCTIKKITINNKPEEYESCTKKTGKFIVPIEKSTFKKGSPCNCYTPGFVIAAEIKSKNTSTLGQEILITRHFRAFGPTIPPKLFEHQLYLTEKGNLIAIGTFVHTPTLNGSYYPFVAVYAK